MAVTSKYSPPFSGRKGDAASANAMRMRSEDGGGSNPLRFLERSLRDSASSHSGASATPRTESQFPFSAAPSRSVRGAKPASLDFLERKDDQSRNPDWNMVASRAGAEGFEGLGGGAIAGGVDDGELLRDLHDGFEDSDSDDDDEDDNVCPSMFFACFPCLACFR